MDTARAYLVLGAEPADDLEIIKHKYHQMMQLYHPDAAGEDEASLFLAQQINEAYTLLRRELTEAAVFGASGADSTEKAHTDGREKAAREAQRARSARRAASGKTAWDAGENPAAFCERLIYEGSGMYDSGEILWHESRRGRYNWDPYKEDFRIFARSINEACGELLSKEERRFEIYDRDDHPDPSLQDAMRLRLFHLLIQQFVQPAFCLDRIAQEHERDEEIPGKYSFECAVGLKGAPQLKVLTHLQPGDMLQIGMDGERMQVYSREGLPLGHVSFHEDSLYYVISLLLQRGGALMEPQVRSIHENRLSRPQTARIAMRLHVRLQDNEDKGRSRTQESCRQMEQLLDRYRRQLEEISEEFA